MDLIQIEDHFHGLVHLKRIVRVHAGNEPCSAGIQVNVGFGAHGFHQLDQGNDGVPFRNSPGLKEPIMDIFGANPQEDFRPVL